MIVQCMSVLMYWYTCTCTVYFTKKFTYLQLKAQYSIKKELEAMKTRLVSKNVRKYLPKKLSAPMLIVRDILFTQVIKYMYPFAYIY